MNIKREDFCKWMHPDAIPKSDRHRYLVKRNDHSMADIIRWSHIALNGSGAFQYDYCGPKFTSKDIERIMILPNSVEEGGSVE